MFGISAVELLVIFLVAVLVIPVRHWGDVAKFLAGCIKFIRNLIWKISDATENIKEQIDLEKPINDLIQSTTNDVMSGFSDVLSSGKNPRNNAHTKKSSAKKSIKKSGGKK